VLPLVVWLYAAFISVYTSVIPVRSTVIVNVLVVPKVPTNAVLPVSASCAKANGIPPAVVKRFGFGEPLVGQRLSYTLPSVQVRMFVLSVGMVSVVKLSASAEADTRDATTAASA